MTTNPTGAAVLVVDDEPDLRTLYEITLQRCGYVVESAADLEQARALLRRKQFAVLVTDMRLPDGQGLELVEWLQQQQRSERSIVVTAYGSADNAVRALKVGAFDYLTKPVNLDQFRRVVAQAAQAVQAAAHAEPIMQAAPATQPPEPTAAAASPSTASAAVATEATTAMAQGAAQSAVAAPVPAPETAEQEPVALAHMIGAGAQMQQLKATLRKVAPSMAPVLIWGESGSGKELVARALHQCSHRADGPFVAVNCGAIPEALLEAEFFGARKGAYTGSVADREGLFQSASGGTLFLDEIGDLPLSMQAKLLRVIQERQVRPLGAAEEIAVDVRIVSATHKKLADMVQSGQFRQDLYYRLNVIDVNVPPLRERREDIHPLALHFLNRANQIHQRNVHLAPEALTLLEQHPWPGNIRELGNVIERLVLLADHPLVHAPELARYLEGGRASPHSQPSPAPAAPAALAAPAAAPPSFSAPTAAIEAAFGQTNGPLVRDYQPAHSHSSDTLTQALALHQGNQSRAAQSLGLTLRQFAYRLKKAGLR